MPEVIMNPNDQNTNKQFRNGREKQGKEKAYGKQNPTIQEGPKVKIPVFLPLVQNNAKQKQRNKHKALLGSHKSQ